MGKIDVSANLTIWGGLIRICVYMCVCVFIKILELKNDDLSFVLRLLFMYGNFVWKNCYLNLKS